LTHRRRVELVDETQLTRSRHATCARLPSVVVTPRRFYPSTVFVVVALVGIVVAGCSSGTENKVAVIDGEASSTTTTVVTTPPPGDLGEPTLTDDSEVTTVGLDAVEFGMTFDDAQKAAGTRLVVVDGQPGSSCYRVEPEVGPEGVSFLVSDGRIERVDIDSGPVTTRSGAGIGMSISELTTLFPERLETAPTPDGTVLTFVPSDEGDADYRIIFQSDGTTVTSLRAGKLPEVEDGC